MPRASLVLVVALGSPWMGERMVGGAGCEGTASPRVCPAGAAFVGETRVLAQ